MFYVNKLIFYLSFSDKDKSTTSEEDLPKSQPASSKGQKRSKRRKLKQLENARTRTESESASEEITKKLESLRIQEEKQGLSPSAGYRSETTVEKPEENKTYAGIPVKLDENGKVGNRWPTAKTAIKADVQRLELLETLNSFIGEANNRR